MWYHSRDGNTRCARCGSNIEGDADSVETEDGLVLCAGCAEGLETEEETPCN